MEIECEGGIEEKKRGRRGDEKEMREMGEGRLGFGWRVGNIREEVKNIMKIGEGMEEVNVKLMEESEKEKS